MYCRLWSFVAFVEMLKKVEKGQTYPLRANTGETTCYKSSCIRHINHFYLPSWCNVNIPHVIVCQMLRLDWVFSPHHVCLPAKHVGNPCSELLRHSILKDKGLPPHILCINTASQSGRCLVSTFPLWAVKRSGSTLHHSSPSAFLPVLWKYSSTVTREL